MTLILVTVTLIKWVFNVAGRLNQLLTTGISPFLQHFNLNLSCTLDLKGQKFIMGKYQLPVEKHDRSF